MNTDVHRLTAAYSSWAAVARDATSLVQGMFLRIDLPAAHLERVDVQIALPDGARHVLSGEVVSVLPGQAIAVQWRPDARDSVERVLSAAASHPTAPASAATPEPEVVALDDDEPDDDVDEPSGSFAVASGDRESLQAQIEAMTVQEKRNAALHGRKDMRWLLVRDQNKSIHPFVVKNPAITVDEIEQIARLTSINPEVLHTIAQHRDWTRSTNVVRNLVKNPKTPMHDALALLDKLPIGDVRVFAKSPSVRAAIQMAARKKING